MGISEYFTDERDQGILMSHRQQKTLPSYGWIEPGTAKRIVQTIQSLHPPKKYIKSSFGEYRGTECDEDHLQCGTMAECWKKELEKENVPVEIVQGQFVNQHIPTYHVFLLVGKNKKIFDPTAAQFLSIPKKSLYVY